MSTHPSILRVLVVRSLVVALAVAAFGLIPIAAAPAQEADHLAKTVDKDLRQAQRLMFSGKLDDAMKRLEAAESGIARLKTLDPAHRRLRSLEGKLARQKRDLSRRLDRNAATNPATPGAAPKKAAAGDKLPGGVMHRLNQVDRTLARADRIFAGKSTGSDDYKAKTLKSIQEQARATMAEIEKRYAGQYAPNHPQVKARTEAIAAFEKKSGTFIAGQSRRASAANQSARERDTQCAEWMVKLAPFVTPASRPTHDKNRYLIPAGTADLKELDRRKKIRDQAGMVMAAYQKASFPAGKTDELERTEKQLTLALADFDRGYRETLIRFLDQAGNDIQQAGRFLDRQEKQDDGKRKPLTLRENVIPDIRKVLAQATAAVPADDPKLVAFNKDLVQIVARNDKLRQVRRERTFLTPDRFEGDERDGIKQAAAGFLKKKHANVKVLRTTVISPKWKEERVVEHTDTTKTAIRYRVTRSVTVQIAGKRGTEVCLYTLHVAKDRRSDATFGPLKGHVMFIDPMLEANVNK